MAFGAADQEKLTGLATFDAPAAGAIAEGAMLLHDGCVLTVTEAPALLLFPFGSLVADTTEALSPALLPAAAVAVIVKGAAGPIPSDVRSQPMVRPLVMQVQPLPDATGAVTPKSVLATRTSCATSGPLLLMLMVKVIASPAFTGFGVAETVIDRSAEALLAMAIVALPEVVHDPVVWLTLMAALPLAPAVHVIDGVPLPLVIVPPLMVQT